MINENISDELKIYELSLIWKEAEYNFAFWGKLNGTVNWDEEYKKALPRVLTTDNMYDYYMELKRFLALLRDGHTDVWFPQTINENSAWLPIFLKYINGKHVIMNIDKSLDIRKYSVINKINGVDIDKYIEKNIFPYIWHEKYDSCYMPIQNLISTGKENSEVEFEILENDVKRNVKIKRVKSGRNCYIHIEPSEELEELYVSDSHTISKTKDDIALITIPTFMNGKLPEEFYSNQKLFENMRGFIIDVRQNGGGNSSHADAVAKAFINGEFQNGREVRPIYIGTYKAWGKWRNFGDKTYEEVMSELLEKGGDSAYTEKCYKIPKHIYYEEQIDSVNHNDCPFLLTQPLVVLSSCNTGSAAEDFLVELDQAKRAIIVGTASHGSTGQPLFVDLESGGGFRICTQQCTYPDGRPFIDIGVQPHIKCEPTLDDYKNGIDSVMNKGLEEIRKLI